MWFIGGNGAAAGLCVRHFKRYAGQDLRSLDRMKEHELYHSAPFRH
jgi:hypothetical protein